MSPTILWIKNPIPVGFCMDSLGESFYLPTGTQCSCQKKNEQWFIFQFSGCGFESPELTCVLTKKQQKGFNEILPVGKNSYAYKPYNKEIQGWLA